MILKVCREEYKCTSFVRTNDNSVRFTYLDETGTEQIAEHSGINDMSVYHLFDNDGSEIPPEGWPAEIKPDYNAFILGMMEAMGNE